MNLSGVRTAAAFAIIVSMASTGVIAAPAEAAHAAKQRSVAPVRLLGGGKSISANARMFYTRRFGVDDLQVKRVSSGSMLEFRYRVVDPQKAQVLAEKKATPLLVDRETGRKVGVPFLENVGTLRQSGKLEEGHEYWMVFENPNKAIPTGSHVDISVGTFHVLGLVVE